jgi:hypothetical protein
MRIITLLFFILIILCCSSFVKDTTTSTKESCKRIKVLVKQHWHFDNDKNYYMADDDLINQIDSVHQNCFIGLSPKKILGMFGKPTIDYEKSGGLLPANISIELWYILVPKTGMLVNDKYIVFYFDANNKLNDIKVFYSGLGKI